MNERNQEQQMESTAKLTAEHAQKLATSQTQQFLDRLEKGDVNKFFESKQLTKLDKFAENMDILADGKLDSPKPYSKIANMPENQRAEALQKTSENLRDNMTKVRGNLTQNLGMYSKQQQAELGLVFKGIDMQGGMDKFMSQHYGLTEKITQNPDFQLSGSEKEQAKSRYNDLAKATGLPTTDEVAKRDVAMKNKHFDFNQDGKVTAQEARFGVAFDANKDGRVSMLENLEGKGGVFGRSAAKTQEMNERLSEAGFGQIKKDGYNVLGGNTFKEQDAMEKLTGDSEEKKGALGNIIDATKGGVANKSNPLATPLANPSAKSTDRDIKPIISEGQAPDVSAPQKGLNIGGR